MAAYEGTHATMCGASGGGSCFVPWCSCSCHGHDRAEVQRLERADLDRRADIGTSTKAIALEVMDGRLKAHAKHGDNSIEAVPADDIARWLPILGEEFGEVAQLLTYDKADPDTGKPSWGDLRAELIDLITVGTAWVAKIDARHASEDA